MYVLIFFSALNLIYLSFINLVFFRVQFLCFLVKFVKICLNLD